LPDENVKSDKKKLRKEVLAARDSMPPELRREASMAAGELLAAFEPFREARTVMFFVSFRSEIDTGEMIRGALGEGKRVAVSVSQTSDCSLLPCELLDFDNDLAPGAYGIPEPKPECIRPVDPAEIDIVLFPGVAFDRSGGRIGYGGGYYDRFIQRLRPGVPLVALAFHSQVIESVPMAEHDRPVDYIVTEKEIIDCRRGEES